MAERDTLRIFGERVRQLRERHHLSQQELAERADVPYQTIWRIERGIMKAPNIYLAARIAKALGASLDFLAGIYDERELAAVGLVMAGTVCQPDRGGISDSAEMPEEYSNVSTQRHSLSEGMTHGADSSDSCS